MENKEFRNALLNAMKSEIAQLANKQKEQKKTRKLENRPSEKSLQSIVDEINVRAYKISNILYYYRWIKHGLKYWANRNVHSLKEYCGDPEDWYFKNWDTKIQYGANLGKTHGEVIISNTINWYKTKAYEYAIICNDENLQYLIQNI